MLVSSSRMAAWGSSMTLGLGAVTVYTCHVMAQTTERMTGHTVV